MDTNDIPDYKILPFMKFVELSGLSERTCREICRPGGSGPPLVRVSKRRLGVRMGDVRAWVKSLPLAA
jgi:prophage regulatory protein